MPSSTVAMEPSPEMRRTYRKGNGALLSEPSPGLDAVYDGASQMSSTSFLFGARGGKWSSGQAYSSSFHSTTPRPWQRKPTRAETANYGRSPSVGPGHYEPFGNNHTRSSSISWTSRGRIGPVGYPFDADRKSLAFQSSVDRFHFAASPKRGGVLKEDCFVLASDARRQQLERADFVDQLQRRVSQTVFQPPQALRSGTAPGAQY